ncbi:MAG: hypothetical protein OXF84_09655 [Bacteroidetes bacterium]|nr:hypothetical protein [Bacteroidota bacterium]
MAFTEPSLNVAIAEVLHPMSSKWEVTAELTGEIPENKQLVLDIFIHNYRRLPVVIENEFEPAHSVHSDAKARLGKTLRKGDPIRFVIELVSPKKLRNYTTQAEVRTHIIENIEFQYALLNGNSTDDYERFPQTGYIKGNIRDLAIFISNTGVSKDALEKSIAILSSGVERAIHILYDEIGHNDIFMTQVATVLNQSFTEDRITEALGIGVTVMVSALLFQQRLAGSCAVRNLDQMQADGDITQIGLLEEWDKVLKIDYWSVFSIARRFLYEIADPQLAHKLVTTVASTAQELSRLGVTDSHDLAGVVFQRFIADRKYLATFYTRPESAVLLAHLAIPMDGADTPEYYQQYRIADYACGTGTLIHAAYNRLVALYDLTGNDPSELHAHMMEKTLTAADVVPSAAHMTASMLSSVFPTHPYANTRVIIPEYGQKSDMNGVALGSLELLDAKTTLNSLFDLSSEEEFGSDHIVKIGRAGMEKEALPFVIDFGSDSLVIMNPPYTRLMSDWEEGNKGTLKQYNALGNTKAVQTQMHLREKDLGKKSKCYNGYHALPSLFCAVADKMVKVGGKIALVLPLTSVQGISWTKFRTMLSTSYEDILVIGMTGPSAKDASWSADTSLVEVLIVAQKSNRASLNNNGTFVSLYERPKNSMEATEVARSIQRVLDKGTRSIKDGPYGGSPIHVGKTKIGEIIRAPIGGQGWAPIGIRELELTQFIDSLNRGILWFPSQSEKFKVPIAHLGDYALIGFAANNIANNQSAAFDKTSLSEFPTYPMLWKSNRKSQTSMIVQEDLEGQVRKEKEDLAHRIWDRRSWAHIAAEIDYSGQSLSASFTEKRTIGGRAWPNIQLNSIEEEKGFVVWSNSTLGLMQIWYHSSRQQGSRGILTVSSIPLLPCLDITALSPDAIRCASSIFDDMKGKNFQRICDAHKDSVRKELDRRVLTEILELQEHAIHGIDHVRKKWCAEYSVRGIRSMLKDI